jgi:hypothetical protein
MAYTTNGANEVDIARLEECLIKFSQVQGIDTMDSWDDS